MAFNEGLAERIREALASTKGVAEIKMFGGLCWTVRGNMAVGIAKEELMVRLAPEYGEVALRRKHARPMDFTGKPMKGSYSLPLKVCAPARCFRVGWTAELLTPPHSRRRSRRPRRRTSGGRRARVAWLPDGSAGGQGLHVFGGKRSYPSTAA